MHVDAEAGGGVCAGNGEMLEAIPPCMILPLRFSFDCITLMTMTRFTCAIGRFWAVLALVLSLVACAKSFDMSGERLLQVGPEWGIVIGSVLVKPVKVSEERKTSTDAAEATYEFDIVQSPPGDPDGESPYAERYRLNAKAGQERIFVSRLRTGRYLVKSFAQERIIGAGGDLGLVFDSMAGEVRYIGRLLVEVPQRVSRGKEYRFTVENARDATLTGISREHTDLIKQAIDSPLRSVR